MSSHPRPDRFELRRVLGKGGVGEVLLTWDRERGEEVALKFVRLAEAEAEAVEAEKNGARLQKELARAASHVPRILEEGNDDEFYYYIMEYVPGKDLSEVLARGPLSENRAIHIAIQLYDFLARLHSFAGEVGGRKVFQIIHGDIKPENIRLQDVDRVRVIDFGIAKQLSLSRSFTKNSFGSLPYLPPERLEQGRVDIHSDLWAAAVVLYSMVGGSLPYAGRTEDTIVRRIRTHEITPLPGTCSRSLQWIIHKALSFEVERRFQTAAAFREHLEILRDGGSLDDVSGHSAPKSVTTQPSQPVESPPAPPRPAPAVIKPAETRKTMEPPPLPVPAPVSGKPSAPPASPPVPPQGKAPTPGQVRVRPAQPHPAASKPARTRGLKWLGAVVALLVLLGGFALYRMLEYGGSADTKPRVVDPKIEPDPEIRPDPYLESARALVDGNVPDEAKFNELREEARKRGLKDLSPFTVTLADAYLLAGKRQLEEAGPSGGPYNSKLLQQAFHDLDLAVINYYKVEGTAVSEQLSEALRLKNQVATILANQG